MPSATTLSTTTTNVVNAGFLKAANGDWLRATEVQRVVSTSSSTCKAFIKGRKYSVAINRPAKEVFAILATRG
jgi:hypothetical protein